MSDQAAVTLDPEVLEQIEALLFATDIPLGLDRIAALTPVPDRKTARQAIEAARSDKARLQYAYQRLLGRPADEAEQKLLLDGLKAYRQAFREDEEATRQFVGDVGSTSETVELAAWSTLVGLLLNLDETLSKE